MVLFIETQKIAIRVSVITNRCLKKNRNRTGDGVNVVLDCAVNARRRLELSEVQWVKSALRSSYVIQLDFWTVTQPRAEFFITTRS